MKEQEIHVFIIWGNARNKTEKLFSEIGRRFQICEVYEIKWRKDNFVKNLKRFYGITLVNPSKKISQCGNGPFLLLIVKDNSPQYGLRKTSLGKQVVNTNIYDSKREFRKFLGGGFPIHGSIHKKEANHNLTLLLGKNLVQICEELPENWDGKIKTLEQDLFGNEWKNFNEVLFVLNNTTNYVIIRNFEEFPNIGNLKEEGDVDLLTDDQWQIPYILNFQNHRRNEHESCNFIKIGEDYIKFDIRYVGDNYFDEKWSKKILKNRELFNGFFVPSNEDYFFSLSYHIVTQKADLPKKYEKILEKLSSDLKINLKKIDKDSIKKILDEFMIKNEYKYTNSFRYKINHNEITRLIGVAIHTWKTEGANELLRTSKGKIKRMWK